MDCAEKNGDDSLAEGWEKKSEAKRMTTAEGWLVMERGMVE